MSSSLISLLNQHTPADEKEARDLTAMRSFALSLEQPFSPSQRPAHFTGSAMVIDLQGQRVCMVLHAKLHRWLQPGGHSNPEDAGDLVRTALREAVEETGLAVRLAPGAPVPFDVDVHEIPARKEEPTHSHLDLRCLCVADDATQLKHDPSESHGAQWLSFEKALALADDPSLKRMIRKAQQFVAR